MTNEELSRVLDLRFENIKPFVVELQSFSKSEDKFGNYLCLNIVKGQDEIECIHDCLYSNEFSSVYSGYEYVPHITVGKLETANELACAYEDVKKIDSKFETIVNKISVEMIGENDESIIIIEKDLI